MRLTIPAALLTTTLTLTACGGDSPTQGSTPSTPSVAAEVAEVRTFYRNNGATLRFRLYYDVDDVVNHHEAAIYRLFERNGSISFVSGLLNPAGNSSFGFRINATGEIIDGAQVGSNFLNPANDNEVTPTGQLISINYASGASHAGYGPTGGFLHNHSTSQYQISATPSGVGGYMQVLNGKTYIFSMGFNTNTGRPTLYTLVPGATAAQDRWNGTVLSLIDTLGVNMTNDAAKAGNTDRVFWTWISYRTAPDQGRLNIVSFDGTNFSPLTSKSIGVVGEGLSYDRKHTVTLVANPANRLNPYVVVRRFNSNILDIYRFTGADFAVVASGVNLPTTLPATGSLYNWGTIAATGANLYLISGLDNTLYKLSGTAFVPSHVALIGTNHVTAIEGTATALLAAIEHVVQTGKVARTTSDVVQIND